jgi:microsomal epoxide hydrolase
MLQIFSPPPNHPVSTLSLKEKAGVHRGQRFNTTGNAYALEHATRPSTIGHILSSSPLALLAWIGEKLRDWTDETPPIEKILEIVTLWWFTETMPRSIYAYRQIFIEETRNMDGIALTNTKFGYSNFPMELMPVPKVWVETLGEMVFFRDHDRGGHFAAMEVPELLADDVKEFVKILINRN